MDLSSLLSKVTESMSATRSFGPAFERDDTTVIPVALVVAGGGGGGASPHGERSTDEDDGGSGAGFGTVSVPLGVYVVRDGNVRWVPAVDVTRLAIAAIGLVKVGAKLRLRARSNPKRAKSGA